MFQVFPSLDNLSWALMPSGLRGEWLASAALYSGGCPTTTAAVLLTPALAGQEAAIDEQ